MNIEEMKFSLDTVQWIVVGAISIFLWFVNRSSASSSEVLEVKTELASVRERVVALEIEMKNMPSEATVRELIGRLERLTAYHEGGQQQMDSMQHSLNRLHDFLLKERAK
ncbi:MAG TPA: DUF2730 family protein [Cellvibrio sp.]|nr:DUF2730 family protein [Cellvibrio sp.]